MFVIYEGGIVTAQLPGRVLVLVLENGEVIVNEKEKKFEIVEVKTPLAVC